MTWNYVTFRICIFIMIQAQQPHVALVRMTRHVLGGGGRQDVGAGIVDNEIRS